MTKYIPIPTYPSLGRVSLASTGGAGGGPVEVDHCACSLLHIMADTS